MAEATEIGSEWKLMNGSSPVTAYVPGTQREYWIRVRPMRRTPREMLEGMESRGRTEGDDRSRATGREISDHLLEHSLLDFLLPSHGDPIRGNAESATERMEQLEEAPPTLCAWIYEELFAINDRKAHAKMLRLVREGHRVSEEQLEALMAADLEEWEAILGNSAASPEPTGEDTPSTQSCDAGAGI